jgi:PEP-CTERM motif
MRASVRAIVALGALLIASPAAAGWLSFQPSPADMGDLDHTLAYTWRIDNIPASIPAGQSITQARIRFDNIANWDNNPNTLFLHMYDTSDPGLRSETDSNDTQIIDAFLQPGGSQDYIDGIVRLLVNTANYPTMHDASQAAEAIGNTYLAAPSGFSMTPTDYTYNFTGAQVTKLIQYLANGGDVALAMDPDCHFFNDGVYFEVYTQSAGIQSTVPEPASLVLLGMGLTGLAASRRRRRDAAKAAQKSTV